jgi:hypothetical protein
MLRANNITHNSMKWNELRKDVAPDVLPVVKMQTDGGGESEEEDWQPSNQSGESMAGVQSPPIKPTRILRASASQLRGVYREKSSGSDRSSEGDDAESASESDAELNFESKDILAPLSSSSTLTLEQLEDAQNLGKHVLYVIHNPPDSTFFILGEIDKSPVWEKESKVSSLDLWVHTRDMECTQDTSWPQSLADGLFHFPSLKRNDENWLNLSSENTTVLALFRNGLKYKGRYKGGLKDVVAKKALKVLQAHRKISYIADFLNKHEADRPQVSNARVAKASRSARPAKRSKKT